MRLDIPAGTAVRFEPGQTREVSLVAFEHDDLAAAQPGAIGDARGGLVLQTGAGRRFRAAGRPDLQ
jgi:hypothetical protein